MKQSGKTSRLVRIVGEVRNRTATACFKNRGTAACNVETNPSVANDNLAIRGSTVGGGNGASDCGDRKGTYYPILWRKTYGV